MGSPDDNNRKLLKSLHDLMLDESSLHFSDFLEVCDAFVKGYSKFERTGVPGPAVALAMLGASLNMFDLFGIRHELPELLRGLAEKIENEGGVH